MRLRSIILILLFSSSAFAQTIRFNEEDISFQIQDNEGVTTPCTHKLLPQVPWWSVTCGKKNYTVNTWVQMGHNKPSDMTKVTLMYDVSEGLASSNEKLVQFHSHYTNIYVESLTYLRQLSSDMDVQNGQLNLIMTGKLK